MEYHDNLIEITKKDYKGYKNTNVVSFYKLNLQGKNISNPTLGKILFTGKHLGETIHRTKRKLHPFICILKELVETGECDGILEPLYKPRKDRITGFYHIKNHVKLAFITLALDILIAQDQDGNKYYMFKKDSQGNLGEVLTSHREPSESNDIIHHNINFVNTEIEKDFSDVKKGSEYWVGDTMKITVIDLDNKTEEFTKSKSKALQLAEDLEYLMEVENLGEMSMRTVFDFKPIYMDRKTQELYKNVFVDFIAPSFFAVVKETKYRNEESADKFKYSIEFIPGAFERRDYNPRKAEVFRGLQGTFIDMRTGNRWLTNKIKDTFGLTLKDGLSFD